MLTEEDKILEKASLKKLHIFIDGSWLFRVCQPVGILASRTERSGYSFDINFAKLSKVLLQHVRHYDRDCAKVGEKYYVTTILTIPENIENLVDDDSESTINIVERIKRTSISRSSVAENAVKAGYSADGISRPILNRHMFEKYTDGVFQEKQVNAALVALLVRSVFINPGDYHLLISGDNDIITALSVAYPEYYKNMVIATTHPDELKVEHRHTSFSFYKHKFDIPPFYLQDFVKEIVNGQFIYECSKCRVIFTRTLAVHGTRRPYCRTCLELRT